MEARVEAVLALHVSDEVLNLCVACLEKHPCPTRRALEGKPAQAADDSIMAAKAHPASKLEAKWRTINPAHVKHPTGDYCVYCRSQWPCEEP